MGAGWTSVCTACILALLARGAAAQGGGSRPARSTLDGVYTEAQAARGEDSYALMCQNCHTVGTHDGTTFVNTWSGRTLWELFELIKYTMPKGDPGTLTPEATIQFVAYLLKRNGLPAGPVDLPADSLILKAIRFETNQR